VKTGLVVKAALLILLFSSALHAATPPPECVAASKALDSWIKQQHGQIRLSDLETNPLADDVRMTCDGTPAAYQKSLAEIMRPWQPAPEKQSAFQLGDAAEGMLSIALVAGLTIASGGAVVGIYSGAMAIAIFASDDDISNK
jgi:hypothetical protein